MKRILLIIVIVSVSFAVYGQKQDTQDKKIIILNQPFDAPSYAGSGGYISSGNYSGTGNAAYFPSGIFVNGTYSWLYGTISFNGILLDNQSTPKWKINPAGSGWFNGGNIGIGTTTPQFQLDLSGPANTVKGLYISRYSSNSSAGARHFIQARSNGLWITNDIGSTSDEQNIHLVHWDNSINDYKIGFTYRNGNVGIGTTSPQYLLDITGKQRWHFSTGINLAVEDWKLTAERGPTINAFNDAGTAHVPLSLAASMIYLHSPYVGIGTINTQGYTLAVKGGILCEEVKVINDVPNSDYVFNGDYKLMNLPILEKFIKQNNHLPEIPSAEEFKKNGYKVGEMDNLLLKKVEELTLYIIELNKKVEALEQEISKKKE